MLTNDAMSVGWASIYPWGRTQFQPIYFTTTNYGITENKSVSGSYIAIGR